MLVVRLDLYADLYWEFKVFIICIERALAHIKVLTKFNYEK